MSSIFEKMTRSIFRRLLKKGADEVFREPPKKKKSSSPENQEPTQIHPWRLCPAGLLLSVLQLFPPLPAYSASSKDVVLHNRTTNFIDIEAPQDKVWVGCADRSPQEKTAFMVFYILDGEKSWEFHYRRILKDSQCTDDEREYRSIIKEAQTIRLAGLHQLEENGPEATDKDIPERFTNVKKITSSTFIRLQANGKCKAYFEKDCELPKNYWGGTIPPAEAPALRSKK